MLSPTTGVNRVIRALTLGMTCVVITVAGHSAANGHISPVGIGIVGSVMVLLAALATSRELTLGQLIAFAGLSQVASHLMLTILAPHSSSMGSSRPLAAFDSSQSLLTGNHIHAAMPQEMPMSMPMSPSFHAVNSSLDLSPSMVILHAAMCVVMALLLRHGEQLYFRLHHVLPHVLSVLVGTAIARSTAPLPARGLLAKLQLPAISPVAFLTAAAPIPPRGPPSGCSFRVGGCGFITAP